MDLDRVIGLHTFVKQQTPAKDQFPNWILGGISNRGSIFGFGLCIIVFGISEVYWISLVALFLSGVTDGISVVIRQTILQLRTPDHMRGRVSAVNSMFVGSSNELGAFESGLAARLIGTVNSVVVGGVITLVTVVGTGALIPSLRNLDLSGLMKEKGEQEIS